MFSLVIVALLGENFSAPANQSREHLDPRVPTASAVQAKINFQIGTVSPPG
jgi:hypothetical protein